MQRNSRLDRQDKSAVGQAHHMEAVEAYKGCITAIRHRFLALDTNQAHESKIQRAERFALQVRKIVEGIAFAALSAAEYRNRHHLREQRKKDADKLLTWLESKGMLRLPNAQNIGAPQAGFQIVFEGAQDKDIAFAQLKSMFSRASELVHERHPERLSEGVIDAELTGIERDARQLREWLWTHIMFLHGEGFLIQMGMFDTPSFFVSISKESELPPNSMS
jgi:hypothetical protein